MQQNAFSLTLLVGTGISHTQKRSRALCIKGCILSFLPSFYSSHIASLSLSWFYFLLDHISSSPFRIEMLKLISYDCLLFERRKFKRGKRLHSNAHQIYYKKKKRTGGASFQLIVFFHKLGFSWQNCSFRLFVFLLSLHLRNENTIYST